VSSALRAGDVVLMTGRQLVRGTTGAESLAIAADVSRALTSVVRRVGEQISPAFVLAKGGITSSDVFTRGLGGRRATVVGSLYDGLVSVWIPEDGIGRGIPYIVFPGNAGDDDLLHDAVEKLRRFARESRQRP